MDTAHDFLSKYSYHLSILNGAKLLDIFNRVVDDEIIISEKLGKGKISRNYLINRMGNCSEKDRKRAREAFELLFSCLTKLDDAHTEKIDSLFCRLIMEGLFAEIYSFRKLVEADLNVIPNLKIKSKTTNKVCELDALIPITKDTVIQCDSTLSETLDKEKIKNLKEAEKIILKETGLRCKTLVIGRECLRSSTPFDAIDLKMLSFSELNNKPKVISAMLSLI
jgi:hypothetical protein